MSNREPAKFRSSRCPITGSVSPNSVASFDQYHISYKPSSVHYGCDTTALVLRDTVFLILRGDHRKPLTEAPDLQGCMEYFVENIHLAHPFGEHLQVTGLDIDHFKLTTTAEEVLGVETLGRLKQAISTISGEDNE